MDCTKIERIADKVREKPTLLVSISDKEYFNMTPQERAVSGREPLDQIIFKARDIPNFGEREKFLLSTIEREKSYSTKEQYFEPEIKGIWVGDKKIFTSPDKVKAETNQQRIKNCLKEIDITKDLIELSIIAKEYEAIEGNNAKVRYSLFAIEGQTENHYQSPRFYNKIEFSEIVKMIMTDIDTPNEVQIPELKDNIPLLKWNTNNNILTTLFYDFLDKEYITWAGEVEENLKNNPGGAKMEIARMLNNFVLNNEGKPFNIGTTLQTLKPNTPKAKYRIEVKDIRLK